jgi:hypothetical protein
VSRISGKLCSGGSALLYSLLSTLLSTLYSLLYSLLSSLLYSLLHSLLSSLLYSLLHSLPSLSPVSPLLSTQAAHSSRRRVHSEPQSRVLWVHDRRPCLHWSPAGAAPEPACCQPCCMPRAASESAPLVACALLLSPVESRLWSAGPCRPAPGSYYRPGPPYSTSRQTSVVTELRVQGSNHNVTTFCLV